MRCQRVRSYLSAYCKEELAGRQRLKVEEHLTDCAACRRVEESVRVFHMKATELKAPALSADFNTKLLNRIAQDRFVETRTKAYLPRRAPLFRWRQAVPVLATVTMAAYSILAIFTGQVLPTAHNDNGSAVVAGLTGSYLAGQPTNNPYVASKLRKDWTLQSQFEQAQRINRISGMLVSSRGFASDGHGGIEFVSPFTGERMPFQVFVMQYRPVVRVYDQNVVQQAQGANSTY